MAYVTRCPYCGAVWLVPDKETADRTPLKCPDCRHSFDATCSLLKVPDELFPGRVAVPLFPTGSAVTGRAARAPAPTASVSSAAPTAPLVEPVAVPATAPVNETAPLKDSIPAPTFTARLAVVDSGATSAAPAAQDTSEEAQFSFAVTDNSAEPALSESVPGVGNTTDETEAQEASENEEPAAKNDAATQNEAGDADEAATKEENAEACTQAPENAPVDNEPSVAQTTAPDEKGAELPTTPTDVTPADTDPAPAEDITRGAATTLSLMQKPEFTSEPTLGNLSGLRKVVDQKEPHAPALARVTTSVREAPTLSAAPMDRPVRAAKKKSGAGSFLLVLLLLTVIAAVASVIFNQKVMEVLPKTAPYYNEVCRKVPCPGFYLHDISAFAVSKTQLRPLDESGNYSLEVVVLNGSDTAQAVPYLQIELVDDNDGSLLRRTLSPETYLDKNQKTVAIAPHGQLTVRINLQTNVTSARCIVTPLYP